MLEIIDELFSVPILSVKLNLDASEIEKHCKELYKNNDNRIVSNQGGFQTLIDKNDKAMKPLVKKIELHGQLLAQHFINDNPQKVIGMWLNVNGHKHSNLAHLHNDCDLSGVYYVKAPEECGQLSFEHPACDLLTYYSQNQNISKMNSWNSQYWNFVPEEDWLYLFPGWLKHAVLSNESQSNRVSIAFNLKNYEV
jgi:uncharacterized protein (TIGR02466 family)|tara:strand:- start:830 stop:1414 length:585 start_codon:yes stop_codon:yes gene_type:complete